MSCLIFKSFNSNTNKLNENNDEATDLPKMDPKYFLQLPNIPQIQKKSKSCKRGLKKEGKVRTHPRKRIQSPLDDIQTFKKSHTAMSKDYGNHNFMIKASNIKLHTLKSNVAPIEKVDSQPLNADKEAQVLEEPPSPDSSMISFDYHTYSKNCPSNRLERSLKVQIPSFVEAISKKQVLNFNFI
ncbi:unnamed protein product [Moneuplotes crassus]|uniref:Uncharacterized protein n=1 Tax=Euplotes crassus TaxID=5936 RepID=A0AAD1U839_EUPCR|nr:unnamed protein product [Moneuplotes crassus]